MAVGYAPRLQCCVTAAGADTQGSERVSDGKGQIGSAGLPGLGGCVLHHFRSLVVAKAGRKGTRRTQRPQDPSGEKGGWLRACYVCRSGAAQGRDAILNAEMNFPPG